MFDWLEFSDEDKLILSFCNIETLNSPPPGIFSNIKNINWESVIAKMDFMNFVPPLYILLKNLKKLDPGPIPEPYYRKIKNAYYSTAASNINLHKELFEISDTFKDSGISLIILKGAGFLQTIYKDIIGIRHITDIDILIRQKDIKRCSSLLIEAGYKIDKASLEKQKHGIVFYKGTFEKPLEIHWSLLHTASQRRNIKINMEKIFTSSQNINCQDYSVSILSAEDSLLYRCIDLFNMYTSRCQCLLDISAIIHYYKELNWDRVVKLAFCWRARFFAYRGLNFSRKMCGVDIPAGILKDIGRVSVFLYGLRLTDQEIFEPRYSLKLFIRDALRSIKNRRKQKYSFYKLSYLREKGILCFFLYIVAEVFALLRFIRRGILNLLNSSRASKELVRFFAVRYRALEEALNNLF